MVFIPHKVGIWVRNPAFALDVYGDVGLGNPDGSDGLYLRGHLDFRDIVSTNLPDNGLAQVSANALAIRTKGVNPNSSLTVSENRLVIWDSTAIDAKQNLRVLVRFKNASGLTIPRGTFVRIDALGELRVASAATVALSEGTIGVAFEDIDDGVYGFVQKTGIAYVLTSVALVPGSETYLSPTTAGRAQQTPVLSGEQADFVVGVATSADHVDLRLHLRGAAGTIYDEPVNVVVSASGDNQITGPVAIDTLITLPLDSRAGDIQKTYLVGSARLEVYLNGQLLDAGNDYLEVGTVNTYSDEIQIKIPLVIDDELTFHIDLSSPAYFAMLGGGSGTGDITDGVNLGLIADGAALFAGKTGTFLQFRRIKGGSGCTVTEDVNSVIIDITGGGGASALTDLTDVSISSLLNNQFLRYDSTLLKWTNQTVAIVSNLDSITDVAIIAPSAGQVLTYNGSIWVNQAPGAGGLSDLDSLSDVVISSPVLGQILAFDGITWRNVTFSGGGATDLNALIDVTISAPLNKQVLRYNGAQWVNSVMNVSSLEDTLITLPSAGQVLTYNGTKWVNATPSGGGGGIALDDLTDVVVSTPAPNHVLKFNGTIWVNSLFPLNDLSNVAIGVLSNGQVLSWDASISKWVNTTLNLGSLTLAGLSDVLLSTPTNGQFLRYNGTKWINQTVTFVTSLAALSDVSLSLPLPGHLLTYNGTVWVNQAPAPSGSTTLAGLTDVSLSSLLDDQALVYNLATTKWKNADQEKLRKKVVTSGANQATLYVYGTLPDVNAINVTITANAVVIDTVGGTAKLHSMYVYWTDIGTPTFVEVDFPDPNGATTLEEALLPMTVRYNPVFTQQTTLNCTYTMPTSGVVKMTYSSATPDINNQIKMVW